MADLSAAPDLSQMRILLTGATGFLGRHVAERLTRSGAELFGIGRRAAPEGFSGWKQADLLDLDWDAALDRVAPHAVINLAARTSEPSDETGRRELSAINCDVPARLFEAVANRARPLRVVLVSSAAVYAPMRSGQAAIGERHPMRPSSFYGQSKAAMAMLGDVWRKRGLDVVVATPFNVIGPGQGAPFVPAVFIDRLRADPGVLRIGNAQAIRDWIDVRDVAAAFAHLVAPHLAPGVFNVSTQAGHSVGDLAERLVRAAGSESRIETAEVDGGVLRSVGDSRKLRRQTGWHPRYSLDRTLADMLR